MLDPLIDADDGRSRAHYRLHRDLPWLAEDGWSIERWGLWRPGARQRSGDVERLRGLTIPRGVPAHPVLVILAWLVHIGLALRRRPGNVYLAYNPFVAAGVTAVGRLRGRAAPVVVRIITRLSSKARMVHRSPLRARAIESLESAVLRRADLVVPMGGFTTQLARSAGVAESAILELAHPPRWLTDRPMPVTVSLAPRLVAAGRFEAGKGFDLLVEAFADIAGEWPDAVLDLAGAGPELRRVQALVRQLGLSGRVRFTGWLPADAMPSFFSGARAAVMPSIVEEGLGMVLVEAGMAGCALVGSRIGGIPEIVQEDVSGLLVAPGDVAALAHALRRLLREPDLARRLGEGARSVAHAYVARRAPALGALRQRLWALTGESNDHGLDRSSRY